MKNISIIRKQKQLNQINVAKKLNVSQGSISKWEQGINKPTYNNLIKLANLFDCTLDELVDKEK